MKYLQGSFTVGGASKEYSENYDRIFAKKCDQCDGKKRVPCGEPACELEACKPCPKCDPR